ncbi:STAS domain-containing protein [Marivirga sp. S37H4]|uniref:Anti-sigma factor antagonist n=1 Tax=Marivirga aurantiaca TaxID=2802615 RepID=A0A934X116_9BACT|nr:STAS domain-containing protein [Marivirga aurantiaca]MBK6266939.1 STAS domain-containing protein [Marivirga aurantiaca]
MKYSIDKDDKYSLLKIKEEKLDSTVSSSLKSDLITMQAEGVPNIVIDLSEVKYIDSSGLSALLVGNRIFGEAGGAFVLASPSEHTEKLIKISQLDKVFDVLPTVHEAIESVFMHELEKGLNEEDTDEA